MMSVMRNMSLCGYRENEAVMTPVLTLAQPRWRQRRVSYSCDADDTCDGEGDTGGDVDPLGCTQVGMHAECIGVFVPESPELHPINISI